MAKITMKVSGYFTVDVPDGTLDEMLCEGNNATDSADFGPLKDIEWFWFDAEHDDGSIENYEEECYARWF